MTTTEYFTKRIIQDGHIESKYIQKVAARADENLQRYYSLLRSTKMEGIEELISTIHRSTFSTAHSHSHHHYMTGTLEHSLGVYDELVKLAEGSSIPENHIILAALLHDISMGYCKEWSRYCGHGRRSRQIVTKYLRDVPREVRIAIELHKHHTNADGTMNSKDYPLWDLLVTADHKDAAKCNNAAAFIEKL